ncbi:MAG: ATP-binding protein [Haloferacaceae archaeon]
MRDHGTAGPTLAGVGAALALAAAIQHLVVEPRVVRGAGPVLAFLLDGGVPLALVYGGYRLSRSPLPETHRWTVVRWCLLGGVAFVAAIAATVLIRRFEGRTVAEPAFLLLVAADAGAVAGAVAGYYSARARHDAERAERARHALGFVNRLLRHDLRNGLAVVRGRAETLDPADPDPERVRTAADTIRRRADRMDDLIESTGAVAETLLGEASGDRIDLTEVVADAVEAVDTRGATVVVDLPDGAPVVANEALRSVVANLVENAIEHGPDDGRAPDDLRVEVTVEAADDAVLLRVADDGVGVPDGEKESIFEPRAGRPTAGACTSSRRWSTGSAGRSGSTTPRPAGPPSR